MANYVAISTLRDDLPSVLQSLEDSLLRRHLDEMEAFVFSSLGTPPQGDLMAQAIIRDLALSRLLTRVDKDRAEQLEKNTLAWLDLYAAATSFEGESTAYLRDNVYEDDLWLPELDTITGYYPGSPEPFFGNTRG
jgi:hypothetical protein